MAAHWVWWVLGVVLIGAELVTGTFYLLAVGIAFVLGGAAAWFGASVEVQLVVAAVLSVVGTWIAHHWRVRRNPMPPDVPLDVGQAVEVQVWHPDGTARVTYRGTQWDAELARAGAPRERTMYIVGTRGSTLLLAAERAA
jgi:membrane protein implicated in regulation of membrane protease activity